MSIITSKKIHTYKADELPDRGCFITNELYDDIKENGIKYAVIYDKKRDMVLDGVHRVEVAKMLKDKGIEIDIPVVYGDISGVGWKYVDGKTINPFQNSNII